MPDKLKQCPLAPGLFEPCDTFRKLGYCPSEVIRKQGNGCPLQGQRMCRKCRCAKEVTPENFYGNDNYCIPCRRVATIDARGGKSYRKMIAVCSLDMTPCPKESGLRCRHCPKTKPTPPVIPMPGGLG